MISFCDFHTQVLGCSHKGDRWAAKRGLAAVCPRKKERDVYQPFSSYTHAFSNGGGAALFCLPCLEKEGEQVTQRLGGEEESESERVSSVKMTF